MGKTVYRPTGSKLLGEELRRLRGSRRLQDICDLSRSEVFAGRIRPIAQPTLSQIENGISMPTIESLNTLAAVYRVSAQRLLNLVTEERLAAAVELPATEDGTEAGFHEALNAGRSFDALALAIHGEKLAPTPARETIWSIFRARALQALGMNDEALLILVACTDAPDLSPSQRSGAHRDLADALLRIGNLSGAQLHSEIARTTLPPEAHALQRAFTLQTRVLVTLAQAEAGRDATEASLREAQRMARECARLDPGHELHYRTFEAIAFVFLANYPVALKELGAIASTARSLGHEPIEMNALGWIGKVHALRARATEAIAALRSAELIASKLGDVDASFAYHYELSELFPAESPEARFHRRKCERFLPLVAHRSPRVVRFERALRGR